MGTTTPRGPTTPRSLTARAVIADEAHGGRNVRIVPRAGQLGQLLPVDVAGGGPGLAGGAGPGLRRTGCAAGARGPGGPGRGRALAPASGPLPRHDRAVRPPDLRPADVLRRGRRR